MRLANRSWSGVALLVLVSACENAKTAEARPGTPSAIDVPRHERPLSEWDTAWVRRPSRADAILHIRASPAGLHIYDEHDHRLTLMSNAGETRWRFSGGVTGAPQLGDVRDVEVDRFGNTYLLDAKAGMVVVVDSLGRLIRQVPTGASDNLSQLVVLSDGRIVMNAIDKFRFRILQADGTLDGTATIRWPELTSAHPLARQIVMASDPSGNRWVVASRLGAGWVVSEDTTSTSAVYSYIEDRPLPSIVKIVSGAGSTSETFAGYTPCSGCDIALGDSSLYMLAGGTAASAKEVIDRYDLRTGRYVESIRFTTRLQGVAVDSSRIYVATEDPESAIIALVQRRRVNAAAGHEEK